jgi:alkanesulfonate monooxygenase SsuD/methylene tetrahydromethanopterin reductase-like flavin-dependent oxidoreductase (luciferase family)
LNNLRPEKLLDFACQAEAAVFDSVFVSDHFQPWKHIDGHAPFNSRSALHARVKQSP